MARKAVCFVDDDPDEVRRFREYMSEHFIVSAGLTLKDALEGLQGKPDVVLLDLYYGPETPPKLRADIEKADEELTRAEEKVRGLLADARQSPDGGFDLAQSLKKKYSKVPIAFFSRKAFLHDALRAQDAGYRLFEKPDPEPADLGSTRSETYDNAFRRHAAEVRRRIEDIIQRNTFWAKYGDRVVAFSMGLFFFVLKIGWDLIKGR